MILQMQFSDKCVPYDTFINDLATALVPKLRKAMEARRDVISQREAFRRYGQGNVLRWRRNEELIPVAKRPGIIEYNVDDLEKLKSRHQDYLYL